MSGWYAPPSLTTCNSHKQPPGVKYSSSFCFCFCIHGNYFLLLIRLLTWGLLSRWGVGQRRSIQEWFYLHKATNADTGSFRSKSSALTCKPKPETADLCRGRTQTWMKSCTCPKTARQASVRAKDLLSKAVLSQFSCSHRTQTVSQTYLKTDFPFFSGSLAHIINICQAEKEENLFNPVLLK